MLEAPRVGGIAYVVPLTQHFRHRLSIDIFRLNETWLLDLHVLLCHYI